MFNPFLIASTSDTRFKGGFDVNCGRVSRAGSCEAQQVVLTLWPRNDVGPTTALTCFILYLYVYIL